ELNKEYISLKNEVAPYKNIAPENISKRVKDTINRHYISLKENRKKIGLKMAEVRYDSLTIDTLKDNIADISRYESNFKVSGWIFAIVGFVGWFGLMIKKHKEDPK
ncbi:MAG: hypothetical protein IAE95_06335, partial [Chitinophagaceae bacterium]|nr:hypothetical protein [Chitinophagaceae bacterium]